MHQMFTKVQNNTQETTASLMSETKAVYMFYWLTPSYTQAGSSLTNALQLTDKKHLRHKTVT